MGNSVEKRTIAQFVHDAVEMETAIYTLDKMVDECKQKQAMMLDESKEEIQTCKDLAEEWAIKEKKCFDELNYLKNKKIKKKKFTLSSLWAVLTVSIFDHPILFALLFFATPIISFVILFNLIASFWWNNLIALGITELSIFIGTIIVSVLLGLIATSIPIVYFSKDEKKLYDQDYQAQLKRHDFAYTQAKLDYDQALELRQVTSERYMDAQNNFKETKQMVETLDYQIQDIKSKRLTIKNNLSNFYKYGIIPPDYRYMDCVIILDQIFRNDLADTMREAIKIYEERVFRGSVIRGMDKICSMLGQLSSDMSAISLKLDMINNNVAHMSGDLERFNQRIASESAKNRAATEELIKETKLGRYTNEKLLESNKRLEYYAEEYRMGRMPIR